MDEQKLKVIFFIVFVVFSIILMFVTIFSFSVIPLVFFLLSLCCTILFGYLLTKTGSNSLTRLLEYHKLKEQLLVQKTDIQKQYLKRKISESQFKMQVNNFDKKLFFLDYKIKYIDDPLPIVNELNRTIEFLQKKYFKQEIPEELYNDIQIELSKELAKESMQKYNLKSELSNIKKDNRK